MLRKYFFLILIAISFSARSQIIHGNRVLTYTDSILLGYYLHQDTIPYVSDQTMTEIMRIPAFDRPESELIHITPQQRYTFNVEMDVELYFGGTSRFAGLFFNTRDGYIGFTRPRPVESVNVLLPEIEDFDFTVISYKLGKIFMYHNQKASGDEPIQHLVSTSNTENHDYLEGNLMTSAPLTNKGYSENFCEGQYNATCYKQEGLPTTWFIYGDQFDGHRPMPSEMQIQKYIGGWGIGFIQTSKGKFIIMEKSGNGPNVVRVKSISQVIETFDPSGFKLEEQSYYNKMEENFTNEATDIENDASKIANDDHCRSEQMAIINFRKENLERQQDSLHRSQSGNFLDNRGAQSAFLSQMNPINTIEGEILGTKLSICQSEYALEQHSGDATLSQRVSCLQQLLSRLIQTKSQMEQIDREYPNIVEANGRKARLLMQVHAEAGCN